MYSICTCVLRTHVCAAYVYAPACCLYSIYTQSACSVCSLNTCLPHRSVNACMEAACILILRFVIICSLAVQVTWVLYALFVTHTSALLCFHKYIQTYIFTSHVHCNKDVAVLLTAYLLSSFIEELAA